MFLYPSASFKVQYGSSVHVAVPSLLAGEGMATHRLTQLMMKNVDFSNSLDYK